MLCRTFVQVISYQLFVPLSSPLSQCDCAWLSNLMLCRVFVRYRLLYYRNQPASTLDNFVDILTESTRLAFSQIRPASTVIQTPKQPISTIAFTMSGRNDSPILPTFSHYRKLSSPTSTLACIAEQPQSQLHHQQQTFLYSPSARSPKTPKWDRYNTFFYSPSVASQRVYHNLATTPTLNKSKCPLILSLPLLGAESEEESDGEDWNQGWDITSVQEMAWENCKLPLIKDDEFKYYPEHNAQVVSHWSDSDESDDEVEEETVCVTEEEIVRPKTVEKVEKKGFGRWIKKMLRKLKGRK